MQQYVDLVSLEESIAEITYKSIPQRTFAFILRIAVGRKFEGWSSIIRVCKGWRRILNKLPGVYGDITWDKNAKAMWRYNFKKRIFAPWLDFRKAIHEEIPPLTFLSEGQWLKLRAWFDPKNTGFVTLLRFEAFLHMNGVIADTYHKQLVCRLSFDWFLPQFNRKEALFLLKNEKRSTFVVHCNHDIDEDKHETLLTPYTVNTFVITVNNGDLRTNHYVVTSMRGSYSVAGYVTKIPTLEKVFVALNNDLIYLYDKQWPSASWFLGTITQDQAIDILKDEDDGTYLARFGRRGNYITVAYRVEDAILQDRVFLDLMAIQNANGYKQYENINSFEELIIQRNHRYVKPYNPPAPKISPSILRPRKTLARHPSDSSSSFSSSFSSADERSSLFAENTIKRVVSNSHRNLIPKKTQRTAKFSPTKRRKSTLRNTVNNVMKKKRSQAKLKHKKRKKKSSVISVEVKA
mmetsp:Transcript_18006/g.20041  ORF Transcript_18006/g.20041 Transcript_18006/m.20041 type:complete len:463 (+) Transcript_18006:230-1618(+)|eukprot:CAMPEP_0168519382 /NCGR_PEP_ID=MMETSP0405-20121227/7284_1 /TAXON_ID=498012 /ORGANISM="Trichosphaerium sp, Strain Am-I-7 wt" /LENGTH=462 /DNA_ID=CAMNT_0008539913 /DNA_START=99 /DNA_END=1487 /DNA_ORIENTATION=+